MLIKGNKKIPEIWTKSQCYGKLMRKFLFNEDIKKIIKQNILNNEQRFEYNKKLKQNLPKIINKSSSYENLAFDSDLIDVMKMKSYRLKESELFCKKFKTLNEEYRDLIKEQNKKNISLGSDSILFNKNNILEYRRKIALKYKNYYEPKNSVISEQENLKNNKIHSEFVKSKSFSTLEDKNFNKKETNENPFIKKDNCNPFRVISKTKIKNPNSKTKVRNPSAFKKENKNLFLVTGIENKKFSFQSKNELKNNWRNYYNKSFV